MKPHPLKWWSRRITAAGCVCGFMIGAGIAGLPWLRIILVGIGALGLFIAGGIWGVAWTSDDLGDPI